MKYGHLLIFIFLICNLLTTNSTNALGSTAFQSQSPAEISSSTLPTVTGLYYEVADNMVDQIEITWDAINGVDYYNVTLQSGRQIRTYRPHSNSYRITAYPGMPHVLSVAACKNEECGQSQSITIDRQWNASIWDIRIFVNDDLSEIELNWEGGDGASYYLVETKSPFKFDIETANYTTERTLTLPFPLPNDDDFEVRIATCNENKQCVSGNSLQINLNQATSDVELRDFGLMVEAHANYIDVKLYNDPYLHFETVELFRRETLLGDEVSIDKQVIGIGKTYQFFDQDIKPSQLYYYRVEGCINDRCVSNGDTFFPFGPSAHTLTLGKVHNLRVRGDEFQDRVRLRWEPVENADSIEVMRSTVMNAHIERHYIDIAKLNGDASFYDDFSIEPGKVYGYFIVPYINGKRGVPSPVVMSEVTYGVGDFETPEPPIVKTLLNNAESVIQFFTQYNDSRIGSYAIFYISDTKNGVYSEIANPNNNTASHTISGLAKGTVKYAKAKYCTLYACSNLSEPVMGRTSDFNAIPLKSPKVNQVTFLEGDLIKVEFNQVEDARNYEVLIFDGVNVESKYTSDNQHTFFRLSGDFTAWVRACNQFGCANKSEETTFSKEKAFEFPNIQLTASHSHYNKIEIEVERKSGYDQLNVTSNVYVSDSLDGSKTRLVSDIDWSSDSTLASFEFLGAQDGALYYFWIETCANNICKFNPAYASGRSVIKPNIPDAPIVKIADVVSSDRIYFDFQKPTLGYRIEMYMAKRLGGIKVRAYLNQNSRIGSAPYSRYYTEKSPLLFEKKPMYYYARECSQTIIDECTDYSEPMLASQEPIHTSSYQFRMQDHLLISQDKAIKPNYGRNTLTWGFQTAQKVYIENGFTVEFDLLFDRDSDLSCEPFLNLRLPIPKGFGLRYKPFDASLLKIYKGSEACIERPYFDEDYLYFELGASTLKIAKHNIASKQNQWIKLKLQFDNLGKAFLTFDDKHLLTSSVENTLVINPTFAQFDFAIDDERASISRLKITGSQFELDRPLDPFGYTSLNLKDNETVTITFGGGEDRDPIHSTLYYLEKDNSLTSLWSDIVIATSTQEIDVGISKNGRYLLVSKRCRGQLCSSNSLVDLPVAIKPDIIDISTYASGSSIRLDWLPVNADTTKIYTGTSPNDLSLLVEGDMSRYMLWSENSGGLVLALQPCKGETCYQISEPIIVSFHGDFDEDGVFDGVELFLGTDMFSEDTDQDGLSDLEEIEGETDPLNPDTDGDGIKDSEDPTPVGDPIPLTANDTNGDGNADILWRNSSTGHNWLWTMNGRSIIRSAGINVVADQAWQIVGRGDFDGDGKSDILWRNSDTGRNYIYLMDGHSIKQQGQLNYVNDTNWQVAEVADVDGDGKDDVIWRHATQGRTWIYLMNGMTTKASQGSLTVADLNWEIVASGDINGDDKADVIWRHKTRGDNYVWLMNGTTIANRYVLNRVASSDWTIAGTGDLNGDGTDDIIWRNQRDGRNWAYLMNDGQIQTSSLINSVSNTNWQIADISDLNGDGKADLFWRQGQTGQSYIYLMNGLSIGSSGYSTTVNPVWQVIK